MMAMCFGGLGDVDMGGIMRMGLGLSRLADIILWGILKIDVRYASKNEEKCSFF